LVRDEAALAAAAAVLLLAPAPPLLFMGEEWAALEPFPWFCDFEAELAARVHAHRSREYPGSPDPAAPATFACARLDWRVLGQGAHARALAFHRRLLEIRRAEIAPRILELHAGRFTRANAGRAFAVSWEGAGERLQLNAGFTFRDATALVPYLASLGVSHVYCSPYFRARAGSTHGYDVVDHNSFNPEIGDRADFEEFVAALRSYGMGHVVDIVPN